MAKAAIAEVRGTLDPSVSPEWIYETDTIKGGGQEDYVISKKRRSFAEWERSNLVEDTAALAMTVEGSNSGKLGNPDGSKTYTQDDADRITAALAMGAISIILWGITVIVLLAMKFCCGK